MKKALLFILFAVWTLWAGAQGMARVGRELARPEPVSGARIDLRVVEDAAGAVMNADRNTERTNIMAYRVRLFSDNSQNARGNAYEVAELFASMYPGTVVEVSYEIPYFWVTAGYFTDHTDAVALRGRVLTRFPKAVVVRQEVPIADVIASGKEDAARTAVGAVAE